ncbi:cell envelope integrity protein TolA [Aeromicrobium sp. Root344]|uniref:cell envelope integrity protein TolA n=1 Tax=Aeromicrobium sp. Root344 TaxID=1736521 RepID=UPI0012FB9336|nr:cell envelope integrity protein TolA [Aeromicrobium sp. Root344]
MLSLSKTGKVQSAVDNLVLTTFSIDPKIGEGRDPNEVATAISTYFGVVIDVGTVRLAIENHLKGGRLLIDNTSTPSCICLAADVRARLAERIGESSVLEDDVRQEWIEIAEGLLPNVDTAVLWRALQAYLGKVFHQHGAEAVQLLDSRSSAGKDKGNLLHLMDSAIQDVGLQRHQGPAREAIRAFFIEPSPKRLRYMSELLDGTFTFFALTVSDATADYLKGQVPSLRLFLDTNVVLAVLGMQDNRMQEADVELLEIIEKERYPFKLYYHQRTFKELINLVEVAKSRIRSRHFTPALSRAYLQYMESRGGGMGIERQFHAMNAERAVDTDAYLARFDHLEDLLRDRGIERFNQNGADLDVEIKGAHIAEFEHFLKNRHPGRQPRSYEARDHDVTVWMFLQRQRSRTTSALRSGALLLSNDYSLQSFDRAYLMGCAEGKGVATVVLPQHLLQILRPFSRVTTDFDKRFMEIFAAPEFRTTQTDYGPTASKVLSYLSSFDDVPTETAVHILNDDLLMGRLRDIESTDSEFTELIESAVIEENKSLAHEIGAITENLSKERKAREQSESAAEAAGKAVEEAMAKVESTRQRQELEASQRQKAEDKARAEAHEKAELQRRLDEATQQKETAEGDASRVLGQATWMRRALAGLLTLVLLIGVATVPKWLPWHWLAKHEHRTGILVLVGIAICGAGYIAAGGKHRGTAFSTIVIASLITLVSLL